MSESNPTVPNSTLPLPDFWLTCKMSDIEALSRTLLVPKSMKSFLEVGVFQLLKRFQSGILAGMGDIVTCITLEQKNKTIHLQLCKISPEGALVPTLDTQGHKEQLEVLLGLYLYCHPEYTFLTPDRRASMFLVHHHANATIENNEASPVGFVTWRVFDQISQNKTRQKISVVTQNPSS